MDRATSETDDKIVPASRYVKDVSLGTPVVQHAQRTDSERPILRGRPSSDNAAAATFTIMYSVNVSRGARSIVVSAIRNVVKPLKLSATRQLA